MNVGLLHELAERLQSAEAYLAAARRLKQTNNPTSMDVSELTEKAEHELNLALGAFHRLRVRISAFEGLRKEAGTESAVPQPFAGKTGKI